MKIRPVEVEVLHWDGRMDREIDIRTVNVTFQNFPAALIKKR